MSQQGKLEKLQAKKLVGKPARVKVGGVAYDFGQVLWGGASPRVCLVAPGGVVVWHSAAEWKALGAKF